MTNHMKDHKDFEGAKNSLRVEEMSTEAIVQFVQKAFPNRCQFKVDWLRLERDIRTALTLDTCYENRLMIIDILLGEHTGRGTEMASRGPSYAERHEAAYEAGFTTGSLGEEKDEKPYLERGEAGITEAYCLGYRDGKEARGIQTSLPECEHCSNRRLPKCPGSLDEKHTEIPAPSFASLPEPIRAKWNETDPRQDSLTDIEQEFRNTVDEFIAAKAREEDGPTIEYLLNLLICMDKGHDFEVESSIGPDSGTEDFTCKRCGFSPETITYY